MSDEKAALEGKQETVKLISSDGFEFIIDKRCAMLSGTIRSMLSGPGQFTEAMQGEVAFRTITSPILEKVCQYLHYKLKYESDSNSADRDIPEFPIEPEIALELLMAANFLDT